MNCYESLKNNINEIFVIIYDNSCDIRSYSYANVKSMVLRSMLTDAT